MDEIKQVLGFDVADGLSNLEKFGQGLSNVSSRLTRFGNNLDKFNARFTTTTGGLNSATGATDKMNQAAERMDQSISRLTTSADLLSRIIFTQLVIKGLRVAEQAFIDATKQAAKLQIEFAKIQGISGDVFKGVPDIKEAVQVTSRDLGIGQIEIAAGVYQTLQNQIGGTKEELLDFTRVAGQFAVGTVTSQANSIDLLSGTIKSYGFEVGRAEELASKFNKTIEIGKVEGSELANVFGRVASRGASLGIEVEELLALFATLTNRGLDGAEAATAISGILTAFTKETPAMKAAIEQLKAPSAEFLLQQQGLGETLRDVVAQTDGTSAAMAKLFPNVRGLNGAVISLNDDLKGFNDALGQIKNTGSDLNEQRFNIIFNTDAAKVKTEINKLDVAMTQAGEQILKVAADSLKFVGGADSIVKALSFATPIIVGYSAAWLGARLAQDAAAASAGGLTKVVGSVAGKLGPIALGIGVAYAAVDFGLDVIEERSTRTLKNIERENESTFKTIAKVRNDILHFQLEADKQELESVRETQKGIIQEYTSTKKEIEAQNKSFVSTVKSGLKDILDARTSQVRQLEQAANDSAQAIETSKQKIQELKKETGQRDFDDRLAKVTDENSKFSLLVQRAEKLSSQAGQALGKATNLEQVKRAREQFEDAQKAIEAARSQGNQNGNQGQTDFAAKKQTEITNRQIRAEESLQNQKLKSIETDKQVIQSAESRLTEFQNLTKEIESKLDVAGKTPAEAKKQLADLEPLLQKLTTLGFDSKDVQEANKRGLTKLSAEIDRVLGKEVELQFAISGGVSRLITDTQAAFDKVQIKLGLNADDLGKALGHKVDATPEGIQGAENEALEKRATLIKEEATAQAAVQKAETQIATLFQGNLDRLKGTSSLLSSLFSGTFSTEALPDLAAASDLLGTVATRLETLSQQDVIPQEKLDQIVNALTLVKDGTGNVFNVQIDALSKAAGLLQAKVAAQAQLDEQRAARIEQLTSATGDKIESALRSGAEFAADRIRDAIQGATANKAHGGLAYHASGGEVRGTDTINAKLSPEEYVVNSKSSRKWYSDLQRMNAGMEPTYRGAGGPVTTVGDVSITVNESKGGKQTGREVWGRIEREFRKGTISR